MAFPGMRLVSGRCLEGFGACSMGVGPSSDRLVQDMHEHEGWLALEAARILGPRIWSMQFSGLATIYEEKRAGESSVVAPHWWFPLEKHQSRRFFRLDNYRIRPSGVLLPSAVSLPATARAWSWVRPNRLCEGSAHSWWRPRGGRDSSALLRRA
ncbi:hypothetical protein CC78DRAFT_566105 [Lojkania enalia]|uniref:Uncharacterized protein n=1 Tax=Lojkania enalia TaxID=147567 RepID=A0A9P4KED5_9PLEO|nr:hypothetical protein CC78DRAFT_566105 [Didymosphaeria enalia]